MPTRREMLMTMIGAFAGGSASALLQTPPLTSATEEQKGDPDLPYETVTFDPEAIRQMSDGSGRRATFEQWAPKLPTAMLASARGLIGSSRSTTPDRIAQFLQLFDLGLKDSAGQYVPFCAAGISYCALSAFADAVTPNDAFNRKPEHLRSVAADVEHYYFYPTVSCRDMALIAQGKRRWRTPGATSKVIPKPGWIVLFDWQGRGTQDHCGIVQSATAESIFTVEFNTSTGTGSQRNGGVIASKTRTYDYVSGFIVTDERPRTV